MFKRLVFFIFLVSISLQIDYQKETEKRCSAEILKELESDGKLRAEMREKYKIEIGMNIDDFEKLLNGDYSAVLKGGPISFIIFGIFLLIFSLVLFIIFCANLCCCKKAETSQ